MSMFNELYAIATTATLSMLIAADEKTGKLTISVVPKPKKDCGEPALSKDLTLTATPEEFDNDFVKALTGYREARQGLIAQAESTNRMLAAATSTSARKAASAEARAKQQNVMPASSGNAPREESDGDAATGEAADGQRASDAQAQANPELPLFG